MWGNRMIGWNCRLEPNTIHITLTSNDIDRADTSGGVFSMHFYLV